MVRSSGDETAEDGLGALVLEARGISSRRKKKQGAAAAVRRLGEGWIGKEVVDWLGGEWEDPEVYAGERWRRRLGGSLEIRDSVLV